MPSLFAIDGHGCTQLIQHQGAAAAVGSPCPPLALHIRGSVQTRAAWAPSAVDVVGSGDGNDEDTRAPKIGTAAARGPGACLRCPPETCPFGRHVQRGCAVLVGLQSLSARVEARLVGAAAAAAAAAGSHVVREQEKWEHRPCGEEATKASRAGKVGRQQGGGEGCRGKGGGARHYQVSAASRMKLRRAA
jgi:hypothetical protein